MIGLVKIAWHRDLVSDPETHAWVLNLYRGGERHPQLVSDYFPAEHAPWPALRNAMIAHAQDERRHTRMYATAITRLGQPVEDVRGADVYNEVIRSCTPVGFHITDADSTDQRRLKLAHFLAHAHFLEDRIARSLSHHLDACEGAGCAHVAEIVRAVQKDEIRHAAYTREAVGALLDRRTAARVLELHKRAEQRANLLFSAEQVTSFLRRFPARAPGRRRAVYRLGALAMKGFAIGR